MVKVLLSKRLVVLLIILKIDTFWLKSKYSRGYDGGNFDA